MVSVPSLAKELHLTRARVYQILNELNVKKDKDGRYIITAEIEQKIRSNFGTKSPKQSNAKIDSQEVKYLKSQLNSQLDEIQNLRKSNDKLLKLVDQSQQLQLMAENKIKQLESKQVDPTTPKIDTPQALHVDAEGDKTDKGTNIPKDTQKPLESVSHAKKSFWQRLFGK